MLPGVASGDLERLTQLANQHRVHSRKMERLADAIAAGVPFTVAAERCGVPAAIAENLAWILQSNLA
jgi:hypothetical protein